MIITAPVRNCSVPPSAEAIPAIGPCSSSAITIDDGITRPRQAKARNSPVIRSEAIVDAHRRDGEEDER